MPLKTRALHSKISEDSILILSMDEIVIGDPAEDEIIVQVEATPINPSDLVLLLGPADIKTLEVLQPNSSLRFHIPQERLAAVWGRVGQALGVGGEGTGIVISAGRNFKNLEGQRVSGMGSGFFADHVKLKGSNVISLPNNIDAKHGAAMFINPLTALGFVETARREGHTAIIHTAAGSNLGQMLDKICRADGIPLVNIVRSKHAESRLRYNGAKIVLNSNDSAFASKLAEAIDETGATIVFDPIGGGSLGGEVLATIERLAVSRMPTYDRYGSGQFKQLYLYGALDKSPTILNQLKFGLNWSVSGWLLFHFLKRLEPKTFQQFQQRIVEELLTTFASDYDQVISLKDMLNPEILQAYERKTTSSKMLVDPRLG